MLIDFRGILASRGSLAPLIHGTLVVAKSSMHTNSKALSPIVTSRYSSCPKHSTYEHAHDGEVINAHSFLGASTNRDSLVSCMDVTLELTRRS